MLLILLVLFCTATFGLWLRAIEYHLGSERARNEQNAPPLDR